MSAIVIRQAVLCGTLPIFSHNSTDIMFGIAPVSRRASVMLPHTLTCKVRRERASFLSIPTVAAPAIVFFRLGPPRRVPRRFRPDTTFLSAASALRASPLNSCPNVMPQLELSSSASASYRGRRPGDVYLFPSSLLPRSYCTPSKIPCPRPVLFLDCLNVHRNLLW